MGAFKPLLPFGNKTVIECCIDYLREGGVETIVVVLGHRADEIREKASQEKVSFAVNPIRTAKWALRLPPESVNFPSRAKTSDRSRRSSRRSATVVSTLIETWKNGLVSSSQPGKIAAVIRFSSISASSLSCSI